MGNAELHAFLTLLALEEQVNSSTQNQALAALQFLYRLLLDGSPVLCSGQSAPAWGENHGKPLPSSSMGLWC
jgi:hypothetical protein